MVKHVAHNDGDIGSNPIVATANERHTMTDEELRKIKEEAFYEGVDHVLDQLRIINPYGDRNGFLDD